MRDGWQNGCATLFAPAVQRFGWSRQKGESELESQLRGDLIAALGTVGEDKACQERAREFFAEYEKAPDAVDRNLVPALVSIVAHTGTAADYEKFYAQIQKRPDAAGRDPLSVCAGRLSPAGVDRSHSGLTINGEVRTQNSPYLMRGILLNRDARVESLVVYESALGRDAAPISGQLDPAHVRRHHRLGHCGTGSRRAGFFRAPSGEAGENRWSSISSGCASRLTAKKRWADLLRG